jgi:hypothetical protein
LIASTIGHDVSLVAQTGNSADCGILLRDVTSKVRLGFRHNDGSGGRYYIVESMSAGLALFDYDNDGDPDLYVNNCGSNVLYRNNGNGTFSDVTEQAGVGNGNRVGAGTCFLDMD